MFKKKSKPESSEELELVKLANKYIKILKNSKKLPSNSREMYRVIRKAGVKW